MTLAEYADQICHKIGQPDTDSIELCKKFVRSRYQTLCREAPWAELLVLIPGLTSLGATGYYDQVLMPSSVERVLKVRFGVQGSSYQLNNFELATPFDYDPSLFDTTGCLVGFTKMASCLYAGNFDFVGLASYDATSGSLPVGSPYDMANETSALVSTSPTTIISGNEGRRVLTIVNIGSNIVFLGIGTGAVAGAGVALQAYGGSYELNTENLSVAYVSAVTAVGSTTLSIHEGYVSTATPNTDTGLTANAVATSSTAPVLPSGFDGATDARVYGAFSQQNSNIPINSGAIWSIPNGFELLSVSKPVTNLAVAVLTGTYPFSFIVAATIPANETEALRCPRIKLINPPTTQQSNILALCKRRTPDLIEDNDAPLLTSCDNALLALGMYDMLQRQRQYSKAKEMLAESRFHIAQMKDLERNQTASTIRIVPDGGFGPGGYYGYDESEGSGQFW